MPFRRSNPEVPISFLLALLPALALAQESVVQPREGPPPASVVQARKTLGMLIDATNFARYGFENAKEVELATTGRPIRRFIIRPDRIRAYRDGVDPASLLEETGDWIYPLSVGASVRCSMTLAAERPGDWKAVSVGQPGLARMLFEARAAESKTLPQPDDSRFFLLEVLSTHTRFLIYRTDGRPPRESPGIGKIVCVWIGKPIGDRPSRQPAEPLFSFLSQLAQEAKSKAPPR